MKKAFFLAPLLAVALAVTGCGGSDTTGIVGNKNPRIRLVNDFADINRVDASVGSTLLLNNQPFGTTSSYTIVDNGNRTITFINNGNNADQVTRTDLLEENKFYTAIGVGGGLAGRQIILLTDGQDIVPNKTKVRFVNAYQGGNVDVYITPTSTTSLAGQTPQLTNVPFGDEEAVYTEYIPGNYKIWVTAAGSQSTVHVGGASQTFATDTVVTYVFLNTPTGLKIQTLVDNDND